MEHKLWLKECNCRIKAWLKDWRLSPQPRTILHWLTATAGLKPHGGKNPYHYCFDVTDCDMANVKVIGTCTHNILLCTCVLSQRFVKTSWCNLLCVNLLYIKTTCGISRYTCHRIYSSVYTLYMHGVYSGIPLTEYVPRYTCHRIHVQHRLYRKCTHADISLTERF